MLVRIGLKAENKYRLRVRGPHQTPAVIEKDAGPVDGYDLIALGKMVGDAGDGNGNDHADWGAPTLTCS